MLASRALRDPGISGICHMAVRLRLASSRKEEQMQCTLLLMETCGLIEFSRICHDAYNLATVM